MLRLLFAIGLFGFPAHLFAQAPCVKDQPIGQRDIVGLESFVEGHEFQSIACFVSALPEDVRAFRTYIKSSLSLQEASPKYPRALVGSPDGGFFITFNGHHSQKGYDEAEFLALDKNLGPTKWIAGSIRKKDGKLVVERDIKKCSACHGDPIRPIWGKYPRWENAFGSIDDWLPDPADPGKGSPPNIDHDKTLFEEDQVGQNYGDYQSNEPRLTQGMINTAVKESRQFRRFREMAKGHPRYAPLEEASDETSQVYPFTENYRIRNIAFRPNLYIGSMMAFRQNQIIENRLANHPAFQTIKPLVFSYYSCSNDKSSEDVNQKIHRLFVSAYMNRFARPMPSVNEKFSDHFVDVLGLEPHEKTMLFASEIDYLDLDFKTYSAGYGTMVGSALSNLLEAYLLTWSDNEDFVVSYDSRSSIYDDLDSFIEQRAFASYFRSKFLGREIYDTLQGSYGGYNIFANNDEYASDEQKRAHRLMCDRLEDLSEEVLQTFSAADLVPPTEPDTRAQPWPEAMDSCIECHDQGRNSVARPIPFSDPEELKVFNDNYQSNFGFGDLVDATYLMTLPSFLPAHQNGERMPLGRRPLTGDESKAVLNWVQSTLQ